MGIDQDHTARRSHAALDRASREPKARKIELLLSRERDLRGARLLEVGIGSGVIVGRLARAAGPEGEAWGVDVLDQRAEREGYRFRRVTGDALPFGDAHFDVVVSNHVIEHVGGAAEQVAHLREIGRVLRPDGLAYLAVPNRWAPVEPHYRLPFLSWAPERLRSSYVRAARAGSHYDCRPLSRGELRRLCDRGGLEPREVTLDALGAMAEDEPSAAVRAANRFARAAPAAILPLIPTLVFVLRRRPG